MHALIHGIHIVHIRLGLAHLRDRFYLVLQGLNCPQYRRVLKAVRLPFDVHIEGRCASEVFVQRGIIFSELSGLKEESLQTIDDSKLVDTVEGDGDNHHKSKPDKPATIRNKIRDREQESIKDAELLRPTIKVGATFFYTGGAFICCLGTQAKACGYSRALACCRLTAAGYPRTQAKACGYIPTLPCSLLGRPHQRPCGRDEGHLQDKGAQDTKGGKEAEGLERL